MSAGISSQISSKPQGVRAGVKIFLGIVSAFLIGALIHGFFGRRSAPPEELSVSEAETPALEHPVSTPRRATPVSLPVRDANSTMDQKGGIRVVSAHRSTKDTAIELRYTVTDVQKASKFAEIESAPHLIDLATGDKAGVGKSVDLPKGLNAHTRMRAAMLSNPQGQGFPPAPYRLVAGKTYQLLVPTLNGAFAIGTRCVLECGNLRSSPVTIEEDVIQP